MARKKEKTLQEKFFWAAMAGPKDLSEIFVAQTIKNDPAALDWRDPRYHNRSGLILAAWNGRVSIVRAILDAAGPERALAIASAEDEDGMTALMLAAARGHDEVIELLLEHGADPFYKGADGVDALAMARSFNRQKTIALLEEKMAQAVGSSPVAAPLPKR